MNKLFQEAERLLEENKSKLDPTAYCIIFNAVKNGAEKEKRLASLNKKLDDITKVYHGDGRKVEGQVTRLRKIGRMLGLSDMEGRKRTTRNAQAIVNDYHDLIFGKISFSCGGIAISGVVIDDGTEPVVEKESPADAVKPPKSPASKKDAITFLAQKYDFPSNEACRLFLLRNSKSKYRKSGKSYVRLPYK